MKSELSSIELKYMAEELQFLIEGKIDQIYEPEKGELLLQFHIPQKGKQILRIIPGKFIYITQNKESYGEPSQFCMYLRKNLSNARLRKLQQLDSERIIELTFEKKEGIKKLIIELFSKGNIILTDENNLILSATIYDKWKERTIRPKQPYIFPRSKHNIFALKESEFTKILTASDKGSVVKALATDIGIGGLFAEEICLLADVEKNTPLDKIKDISVLFPSYKKILNKKIDAAIISKKDEPVNAIPFDMEYFKEKKSTETFSQAIDTLLSYHENKSKVSNKDIKLNKIQSIIDNQKKHILKLEKDEVDFRKKGDLIYAEYQKIKEIIEELNKAIKKHGFKEVKDQLKGHKMITEINPKEKKIIIDI